MTTTKRFLSGRQIDQLHRAKRYAQQLEGVTKGLPCWIFEEGQALETLQAIKEIQTTLESLKEVSK